MPTGAGWSSSEVSCGASAGLVPCAPRPHRLLPLPAHPSSTHRPQLLPDTRRWMATIPNFCLLPSLPGTDWGNYYDPIATVPLLPSPITTQTSPREAVLATLLKIHPRTRPSTPQLAARLPSWDRAPHLLLALCTVHLLPPPHAQPASSQSTCSSKAGLRESRVLWH